MIELLLAGLLGYLLGAVPTGVLVCRVLRGVDVRGRGSGHTGGLNVSRVAGLWAGVVTGLVDAALGLAAVATATLLTSSPWAATVAGVAAVVGHNWSVFIALGGGIGLSSLIGALLYLSPLRVVIALVVLVLSWLALTRLLRQHRARCTIVVVAAVGPLLWALGEPLHVILLGAVGGLLVAMKTLPDWNREYGRT
jgi:glycerol-3-phosphate acyltransferase PlsY